MKTKFYKAFNSTFHRAGKFKNKLTDTINLLLLQAVVVDCRRPIFPGVCSPVLQRVTYSFVTSVGLRPVSAFRPPCRVLCGGVVRSIQKCSLVYSNVHTSISLFQIFYSIPTSMTSPSECRTCRACRACCDVPVSPWCSACATQHVTTFSCAKMHGLDGVTCRDVTGEVEFGRIFDDDTTFHFLIVGRSRVLL